MKSTPHTTVPATAFALLAITASMAEAQGLPATGFAEGEAFPAVALPSLEDGRPMSLADFRGKKLLLHVFASW